MIVQFALGEGTEGGGFPEWDGLVYTSFHDAFCSQMASQIGRINQRCLTKQGLWKRIDQTAVAFLLGTLVAALGQRWQMISKKHPCRTRSLVFLGNRLGFKVFVANRSCILRAS